MVCNYVILTNINNIVCQSTLIQYMTVYQKLLYKDLFPPKHFGYSALWTLNWQCLNSTPYYWINVLGTLTVRVTDKQDSIEQFF